MKNINVLSINEKNLIVFYLIDESNMNILFFCIKNWQFSCSTVKEIYNIKNTYICI